MNEQKPVLPDADLEAYAEGVRARINLKVGGLFPNNSPQHAKIILREFVKAATKSVHVYCGSLDKDVYEGLQPFFRDARKRGVEVKVLTHCISQERTAGELYSYLREKNLHRNLATKDAEAFHNLPHFAIIDGDSSCGAKYRLEVNERDKTAVVCAYASDKESCERAHNMEFVFSALWSRSLPQSA